MYDDYHQNAWRTDEQLLDASLKRVFGDPPKMDATFERLLDELSKSSERRSDERND